jgi:heterodisulfide reductase subunit A-like polyferredoxin
MVMQLTKSPTLPSFDGSLDLALTESRRTDEADAIVVGSGINGLVAAAELAHASWSVILLERNAEIGGFIACYCITR